MKPRISVIIPFYNGAFILSRAVESVRSQSYENWELILVNDGSVDASEAVAKSFLSDLRISYLFQENNGVGAARNRGAEKAKGDWLIFLDSDDELNSDALLNFKIHIDSHPDFLLFIAGNVRITSSKRIINFPEKGKHYPFLAGTFCLHKRVFSKAGGYDTILRFSENTELFHRVLMGKIEPSYLNDISLIYHESENGGSKNLQNMIDSLLIILDKHQNTLSSHVKYLYHQIIGVNYMRFQNFSEARKHLLKATSYKPYKAGTLARLCISLIPPLAKKLYPKEVKL